MASDSDKEATFHLRYERAADRFTIKPHPKTNTENTDEALLILGDDPAEYIIFNNNHPGRIEHATHRGDNFRAIKLLSMVALNDRYHQESQKARKAAEENNDDERFLIAEIPFSARQHMARIGLHGLAIGAPQKIVELYKQMQMQAETAIESDGESPTATT